MTRGVGGRRAFTLLEVLVALVLVAGVATAVLRIVRTGVRAAQADAVSTAALFAAMDELARVRLHPPPPGEETTTLDGGLRLERRVRPTLHPSLLEVRIRVAPAGSAGGVELVEILRAPLV